MAVHGGGAARRLQLLVKSFSGRTVALDAAASDSVSVIKTRIWSRTGIRPSHQRLISAGRQLEEGWTFADFGIHYEAVLHVLSRLRGGMQSARGSSAAAGDSALAAENT